jgi:hypothetical protein
MFRIQTSVALGMFPSFILDWVTVSIYIEIKFNFDD